MVTPVLHKVQIAQNEFYHIKTSDAYAGLGAITGLTKVADPTGKEEIMKVDELLRSGVIWRIGIGYKSGGKMKSAELLVVRSNLAGLFGEDAAKKLEDKNYTLNGVVKGKIESIHGRRKASFR